MGGSPSLLLGSPVVCEVAVDYAPTALKPLGTPNQEFAADAKQSAASRRAAMQSLTLTRLRSVGARASALAQVGGGLATAWQQTMQQATAIAHGAAHWKAENQRLRSALADLVAQLQASKSEQSTMSTQIESLRGTLDLAAAEIQSQTRRARPLLALTLTQSDAENRAHQRRPLCNAAVEAMRAVGGRACFVAGGARGAERVVCRCAVGAAAHAGRDGGSRRVPRGGASGA